MSRSTGPSPVVRALVLARARERCERCGLGLSGGVEIHHRRPRGMGGTRRPDTNEPSNLLALCLACHRFVEREREQAIATGFLVSTHADPATVSVLYRWDRWLFLTADGGFSTTTPITKEQQA